VKFFSVELLLCLTSTQLYAPTRPTTNISAQWPGVNSNHDILLNFLYSRGETQLREALGSLQHHSGAFSACLAVQLVRGLVVTACSAEIPDQLSVAERQKKLTTRTIASSGTTVKPTTVLLTQLTERYRTKSNAKLAGGVLVDGSAGSGAEGHGVGAAVQDIILGTLTSYEVYVDAVVCDTVQVVVPGCTTSQYSTVQLDIPHNYCTHWTDCCVVPVYVAEFLRLLPFGVLHRLFAHSTTAHAISNTTSTTAGGAAPSHHHGSPPGSPTASTTGLHSVGSLDSFAHGDTAGTPYFPVVWWFYMPCVGYVCAERGHSQRCLTQRIQLRIWRT
jgi:hypothetical protein